MPRLCVACGTGTPNDLPVGDCGRPFCRPFKRAAISLAWSTRRQSPQQRPRLLPARRGLLFTGPSRRARRRVDAKRWTAGSHPAFTPSFARQHLTKQRCPRRGRRRATWACRPEHYALDLQPRASGGLAHRAKIWNNAIAEVVVEAREERPHVLLESPHVSKCLQGNLEKDVSDRKIREEAGGDDGARTRDLRRDRPAF